MSDLAVCSLMPGSLCSRSCVDLPAHSTASAESQQQPLTELYGGHFPGKLPYRGGLELTEDSVAGNKSHSSSREAHATAAKVPIRMEQPKVKWPAAGGCQLNKQAGMRE